MEPKPAVSTALRGPLQCLIVVAFLASALKLLPLFNSRDDFIRYYYGGYVGFVQVWGTAWQQQMVAQQRVKAAASLAPYELSRFATALTPYSLWNVFIVGMAEAIRSNLPMAMAIDDYVLWVYTLWWGVLLPTQMWIIRKSVPGLSAYWFLLLFVVFTAVLPHTPLMAPVPRAFSVMATTTGLCLLLCGRKLVAANACLALACLAHPYQQLVNGAVVIIFAVAAWPGALKQHARDRALWATMAVQLVILIICFGWMWAITPYGAGNLGGILGVAHHSRDALAVLKANLQGLWAKRSFTSVCLSLITVGVAAAVHTQKRAGLRIAATMTVLSLAMLWLDGGYYTNEYLFRFLLAVNGISFVALLLWQPKPCVAWLERAMHHRVWACRLALSLVTAWLIFGTVLSVNRRLWHYAEHRWGATERLILDALHPASQPQ